MKIIVCKNYDELSKKAADIIIKLIKEKPNAVLGLATGSTPEGLYKNLSEACQNKEISFKDITTYNLDEYIGISGEHDQSYRYFMDKHLFNNVDIDKNNTYVANGMAKDLDKECKRYEKLIKDLGYADIQVLGIGQNGHIGFNEPSDKLIKDTHIEELEESTIKANSRFFESTNDVPKKAITMGMGSILNAREIILLASGKSKKEVMKSFNNNEITTSIPASFIKLHPNVTIIMDEDAAN